VELLINRLNIRNKWKKPLHCLYALSKSNTGQLLLGPIIVAPTYFLSLYLDNETFKKAVTKILPEGITQSLDGSILIVCLIAFTIMYVLRLLLNKIEKDIINEDVNLAEAGFFLLEMLDQPVNAKAKRFGEVVKALKDNNVTHTCHSVFNELTKPEVQINLICDSIYEFFKHAFSDADFRVRLIKLENNLPVNIEHWAPYSKQPTTSIETLNDPNSTIN
jgi:hypothetical protein